MKYKNYNVGNGYLLSTHDLAVYKGLDKIEEAGVFSLKLEGRMKSADYVGTIVQFIHKLQCDLYHNFSILPSLDV